jgi:hypothetical protein
VKASSRATLVSLLLHLWVSLGANSVLDCFFGGEFSKYVGPLSSIYLFGGWSSSAIVAFVTHLVNLCLDCVNERNHTLFRNSTNSSHQMLDRVKFLYYRWLRTTNITLVSTYHIWWSSPLICLSIDKFLYFIVFLWKIFL